jgi:hypothetical protein
MSEFKLYLSYKEDIKQRTVSQLFGEIPLCEQEMWVQEMQTWLWVPLEKNVESILTFNLCGLIKIWDISFLSAK